MTDLATTSLSIAHLLRRAGYAHERVPSATGDAVHYRRVFRIGSGCTVGLMTAGQAVRFLEEIG